MSLFKKGKKKIIPLSLIEWQVQTTYKYFRNYLYYFLDFKFAVLHDLDLCESTIFPGGVDAV